MTAIELCNVEIAPAIGEAIRENRAQSASVEAGCGVHTFWRPGFIGDNGNNGCRAVILEVLRESGRGLSTRQIVKAARAKGLVNKYPLRTFTHTLANVLEKTGEIVVTEQVAYTGGRGRPGFVWALGPAAMPKK